MNRSTYSLLATLLLVILQMTATTTANSQSTTDLAQRAASALQSGDLDAAIRDLTQVVQSRPDDGVSWFRLGMAYHQKSAYRRAIRAFTTADSLGTASATARYNIACAHSRLGDVDASLTWLHKAVEAGFRQHSLLNTDGDLAALRSDSRFPDILETVKRKATPCMYDDRYRTMDFWVGNWNVFVNGRQVGTNTISVVSDGCALLEDWKSGAGNTGMSLNFYDPAVGKWKQTWIGQEVSEYVEVSHGDSEILLQYDNVDSTGTTVLNRLLLKAQPDGSVRQLFTSSSDEGKSWTTGFDGSYVRMDH